MHANRDGKRFKMKDFNAKAQRRRELLGCGVGEKVMSHHLQDVGRVAADMGFWVGECSHHIRDENGGVCAETSDALQGRYSDVGVAALQRLQDRGQRCWSKIRDGINGRPRHFLGNSTLVFGNSSGYDASMSSPTSVGEAPQIFPHTRAPYRAQASIQQPDRLHDAQTSMFYLANPISQHYR